MPAMWQRYTVEGTLGDIIAPEGLAPPFHVFDAKRQDWLPRAYRWRWAARLRAWFLNLTTPGD